MSAERDTLTLALADLRADYRDAIRSLNASVEATVAAQGERDEALATIAELDAAGLVLSTEVERLRAFLETLLRDPRVPKVAVQDALAPHPYGPRAAAVEALEPAQDVREGTSKAMKGESQPCESPNPATGLTEPNPTKGSTR